MAMELLLAAASGIPKLLHHVRVAQALTLLLSLVAACVRVPLRTLAHAVCASCLARLASIPVPVDAESRAQIAASVSRRASASAVQRADPAVPGTGIEPTPGPTPVIVLVRSRRRTWTLIALLIVASTYIASGALIVMRAIIPFGNIRVWQPDLPLWRGLDTQAWAGALASVGTVLAILYEERSRHSRGNYGRGKVFIGSLVGAVMDTILFVLILSARTSHTVPSDPDDALAWAVPQLVLLAIRSFLVYPIVLLFLLRDQIDFVPAADTANEGDIEEPSDRDALLSSPSHASYGAASAFPPVNDRKDHKFGEAPPSQLPASPPPSRVFYRRLLKLFPYLWPKKTKLQIYVLLSLFMMMINRVINFYTPLTLGRIVGELSSATAIPWAAITTYVALRLTQSTMLFVQRIPWFSLGMHTSYQLGMLAFDHILELPMSFHAHRNTGELLRVLDRGAAIDDLFRRLIYDCLPIILDVAVAVTWCARVYTPSVSAVLLLVMACNIVVSVRMSSWRAGLRREMNNLDSKARSIHTDVLLCWHTVATFANEPYESSRYGSALSRYLHSQRIVTLSLGLLNWVQQCILCSGMLITYLIVAHTVVQGKATAAQFVQFTAYLVQLYAPITSSMAYYAAVQQNMTDSEKLLDLLALSSDVEDVPGAQDLVVTEGVVEFQDVWFSYPSAPGTNTDPALQAYALQGLSFTLPAHSACGLAGPSGSGKSTIMRLLLRFYHADRGRILIDGQDIRNVTLRSLRQAWGVVQQDPSLFNANILQNISYGRPGACEDDIIAAARHAQIWDRIERFPDGLHTVVGERGVRLSGGEIQRVALARAFLRDAPLLMLDEASSSLDSATEKQLQYALHTLLQGRTSLSIAHRLSTMINSAVIFFVKDGRMVEQGTHEELLAMENGEYKRMWLKQILTERQQQDLDQQKKGKSAQSERSLFSLAPSPPPIPQAPPRASGTSSPVGFTVPVSQSPTSKSPLHQTSGTAGSVPHGNERSEAACHKPAVSPVDADVEIVPKKLGAPSRGKRNKRGKRVRLHPPFSCLKLTLEVLDRRRHLPAAVQEEVGTLRIPFMAKHGPIPLSFARFATVDSRNLVSRMDILYILHIDWRS